MLTCARCKKQVNGNMPPEWEVVTIEFPDDSEPLVQMLCGLCLASLIEVAEQCETSGHIPSPN